MKPAVQVEIRGRKRRKPGFAGQTPALPGKNNSYQSK
jgi:hypothetical protein